MKFCTKCTIEKPFSEFNKCPRAPDGHEWKCKQCQREFNFQWRAKAHERRAEAPSEKSCKECGKIKEISDFPETDNTKDGHTTKCRGCRSDIAHQKYLDNKDEVSRRGKIYRERNKEQISERRRALYHDNPEKYREEKRVYYYNNREERIAYGVEYTRKRRRSDPMFAMAERCRARILSAFRHGGYGKKTTTREMIGCTWDELIEHLESQFKPGMTWDNRGEWHIDHIVPMATAKTEEDLVALCHYTNLQPLWAEENFSKGARLSG